MVIQKKQQKTQQKKSETLCKYYLEGIMDPVKHKGCNKGNDCPYIHEIHDPYNDKDVFEMSSEEIDAMNYYDYLAGQNDF